MNPKHPDPQEITKLCLLRRLCENARIITGLCIDQRGYIFWFLCFVWMGIALIDFQMMNQTMSQTSFRQHALYGIFKDPFRNTLKSNLDLRFQRNVYFLKISERFSFGFPWPADGMSIIDLVCVFSSRDCHFLGINDNNKRSHVHRRRIGWI